VAQVQDTFPPAPTIDVFLSLSTFTLTPLLAPLGDAFTPARAPVYHSNIDLVEVLGCARVILAPVAGRQR
jgi:hypothetical protein